METGQREPQSSLVSLINLRWEEECEKRKQGRDGVGPLRPLRLRCLQVQRQMSIGEQRLSVWMPRDNEVTVQWGQLVKRKEGGEIKHKQMVIYGTMFQTCECFASFISL